MPVKEILLLGNPELYKISTEIKKEELKTVKSVVKDLHDTLMDFKQKYKAGRAIAAPQIGVTKRLIYQYITEPVVYINPDLSLVGNDTIHIWDDCMSFPDILVKVRRHRVCRIQYYDLTWEFHNKTCKDDLSELLQHEYDHLNGVLAVSRAINGESFCLRSQKHFIH
jgi:peptide deformylase